MLLGRGSECNDLDPMLEAVGAGQSRALFLCPIVVGGGKRALPDNVRTQLELLDERQFRNGVVHLYYRVTV